MPQYVLVPRITEKRDQRRCHNMIMLGRSIDLHDVKSLLKFTSAYTDPPDDLPDYSLYRLSVELTQDYV
jgi:hypothetical protein